MQPRTATVTAGAFPRMKDGLFKEIKSRQARILASLGTNLLVLPSGIPPLAISLFRQDSNFAYLTGFPEKEAVAVFDPEQESAAVCLFVKDKNRRQEVWEGFAIGVAKAGDTYPADKVHDIKKLEEILKKRLKGRRVFYRPQARHPQHALLEKMLSDQDASVLDEGEVFDTLAEMRMIKSAWELEQIRRAVAISGEAHHACMRAAKTHRFEYQMEALFNYTCTMQGVRHLAFGTIVAAGAHGTCQHYVDNAGPLADSDLVLIDAGASWNGYCADITRTFPVAGSFSPIQRDLYEIVLAAQKAGVAHVAPGIRMHELHEHAARVLIDGLKGVKLLYGSTDDILEKKAYRDFWPAGLSHSLGIDVHDVTPRGFSGADAQRTLVPGMVVTVEPGVYTQDFNHQVPEDYRHIGIRIEDDVLVTEDGHENLSAAIVKEIADVEAMAGGQA